MRKIISILLTLVLIFSTAAMVFAEDDTTTDPEEDVITVADDTDSTTDSAIEVDDEDEEAEEDEEAVDEEDEENEDNNNGNPKGKAHGFHRNEKIKEEKDALEEEKDQIENEKDTLEDELETLEEQIEAAEAAGTDASALIDEFNTLKAEHNNLKTQMRQKIMERRNLVRNGYSAEEMETVEEAKEALNTMAKKDKTMKVLPVDSIISSRAKFKFDTPPVIKSGRTVVPVRAISEAFGADVGWDGETKTVTITTTDTVIALEINSNVAEVDGEEITFDSKSEIMNSRTYVPLRFISETLGINVHWDDVTETIELDDSEQADEQTTDEATTDDDSVETN